MRCFPLALIALVLGSTAHAQPQPGNMMRRSEPALAAPAEPPAASAIPEEGAPAPAAESAPAAADEVAPPASEAAAEAPTGGPTARGQASAPAPRRFSTTTQESESHALELLAVCALLALWLFSRLIQRGERPESKQRAGAKRSAPLNADELGWALFSALRDRNLDGYRNLFLNGSEAVRVLGRETAERYLAGRSLDSLQAALDQLALQVPPEAVFAGAELQDGELCVLRLRIGDEEFGVAAGVVAQVGAVLRLLRPAD